MKHADKDLATLTAEAADRGVTPEPGTGSGANGNVIKADLVAALERADAPAEAVQVAKADKLEAQDDDQALVDTDQVTAKANRLFSLGSDFVKPGNAVPAAVLGRLTNRRLRRLERDGTLSVKRG